MTSIISQRVITSLIIACGLFLLVPMVSNAQLASSTATSSPTATGATSTATTTMATGTGSTTASSTATSTASTTPPANPYANIDTNYDAHRAVIDVENRIGAITRNLRTSVSGSISATQEIVLLNQIAQLDFAILSLRNSLSTRATMEVIIDPTTFYAQARLLDADNNEVELDFFFSPFAAPSTTEAYVDQVAIRAASVLGLNNIALERGAQVVTAFSTSTNATSSPFFPAPPATTTAPTTVVVATTTPTTTAPVVTVFTDRTNIDVVHIIGDIDSFEAEAVVTFGPETVSGTDYGTTTVTYEYTSLIPRSTGTTPPDMAEDLRMQIVEDVALKTNLPTQVIFANLLTSIELFSSQQEVRDYADTLASPEDIISLFGTYSTIDEITLTAGSHDQSGFVLYAGSDTTGEFIRLAIDPDFDSGGSRRGDDFDYSLVYSIQGYPAFSDRDDGIDYSEILATTRPIFDFAGSLFGVTDDQLATEALEFLILNETHYDARTSFTLTRAQCHMPEDVRIVTGIVDYYLRGFNLVDSVENLILVQSAIQQVDREDGTGCRFDTSRNFFEDVKAAGVF